MYVQVEQASRTIKQGVNSVADLLNQIKEFTEREDTQAAITKVREGAEVSLKAVKEVLPLPPCPPFFTKSMMEVQGWPGKQRCP